MPEPPMIPSTAFVMSSLPCSHGFETRLSGAPHHEAFIPHPEEAQSAVSKDVGPNAHSVPDLDIEYRPDPMAMMYVVRLEVRSARVEQPNRPLLPNAQRHAVGREREDPTGGVEFLRGGPA